MNENQRVTLNDSPMSAIIKMAEGNPGAVSVLAGVLKDGGRIDPDAFPLMSLLGFDSEGIYGKRVWTLYKDVCGQNLSRTIAVMRAVQLGIISDATLHHAIDNYGEGLDVDAACKAVKERLPNFVLDK